MRAALFALPMLLAAVPASAGVFEVCKGESKPLAIGTGQQSIAIVFPDDFPGRMDKKVVYPIGEKLAVAEKAKVLWEADVDAAVKLVKERKWEDKSDACSSEPGLMAVLGIKHPNLTTAHAKIDCDATNTCSLVIDLERHSRPSAERWIRYAAPIVGDKTKVDVIAAAAKKLAPKGPPPDAPSAGLAVKELLDGKVTTRSDADGALELDRLMESNPEFAACGPKNRKAHDTRGYWAQWKLNAKGTAMEVQITPFGGRDPADEVAASCLKKALQKMQLACPRDGKVADVKTAICL